MLTTREQKLKIHQNINTSQVVRVWICFPCLYLFSQIFSSTFFQLPILNKYQVVKSALISFCELSKFRGSKSTLHAFFKNLLYIIMTHQPQPWIHFSSVAFSVIEWIISAIFSLLSATMVTYSGHRWLFMPKEVINMPPEWLLETRTMENFLWTQKMSVRP